MGCHTLGYFKVKSMRQEDFDKIKSYCDECADKVLEDKTTPESIYEKAIRCKLNLTIEEIKKSMVDSKKKAKYYKDNIKKDKTLIRYYTLTKNIDNEAYVCHNTFLDWYIRVNNYPEGLFKSAEEIINVCEKDNWESAYWFDDEEGHIVRAKSNVSEAKERINKIFDDYPNVVIKFG